MDSITEMIAGQHFLFQRGEERLRGSIIEARSDPPHRLPNPQLPAQLGERVRGIGATAVGMEYDPLGLLTPTDRLAATTGSHRDFDRSTRQISIRMQAHGRFFAAIRQHRWHPGLLATALFFTADHPRRPDKLPRALTEQVMTQLEQLATLD